MQPGYRPPRGWPLEAAWTSTAPRLTAAGAKLCGVCWRLHACPRANPGSQSQHARQSTAGDTGTRPGKFYMHARVGNILSSRLPMPRQQTAMRWVVAAETATSQRLRHCGAAPPALSGVHAGIGRLQRPLAQRPLWQQHRSHVDCQRSGRRRQAEAKCVHQRRHSGWSSSVRERQLSIHTSHAHLGDMINGGRLGRYCSCPCSGVQDRGAVT